MFHNRWCDRQPLKTSADQAVTVLENAGPFEEVPIARPRKTSRRKKAHSSNCGQLHCAQRRRPGAIKGVLEALRDTDVRDLLDRISAPTLVFHRRGDRAVRIGAGRHLASHIAQARLFELDGADHWAFAGDQQPVLAGIKPFISSLAA